MAKVLEARDLSFQTPDGRPLIQGLGFSLEKGATLAITGPNGCGKSTLLTILLGESRALTRGSVAWHLPRKQVAYLPQLHSREFHIGLTLADVLSFVARYDAEKIAELSFGLLQPAQLGIAWNTASGGERQKALLTSLFLRSPELLILDEPMNHLDVQSREQLLHALADFTRVRQSSLIIVAHESSLDIKDRRAMQLLDMKGYAAS